MTKIPPYRRTYDDARIDASYRAFVDGAATLRSLQAKTGLPFRTASRYASKDQWVDERDERTKVRLEAESEAASMATAEAAVATAGDIDAKLAAEAERPQFKTVAVAVLKQQQEMFDKLGKMTDRLIGDIFAKAEQTGSPVAAGRLIPIVKLAELVATNARRAYGIPDVSKLIGEFTGANGEPLIPSDELTDAERAARLVALFDLARARGARRPPPSEDEMDTPPGPAN